MTNKEFSARRVMIKSSLFGLLAASIPNIVFAGRSSASYDGDNDPGKIHDRYPAIKLEIASEVVGASHFDLEKLKKLVEPRPELAKATWDFGFGDWESAIAAASHVGRADIVNYLTGKGAAPTLFTFAMLGNFAVVKSVIESAPGVQRCLGPHGISLLQHARTGLSSGSNKIASQQLIDYLQQLGDADGIQYPTLEDAEKEKYLGDYIYNNETQEGFSVKLNMRKMLSLGKKGKNGGSLYLVEKNTFTYNGAPSVRITFNMENDKVVSLTLTEPGLVIVAKKTIVIAIGCNNDSAT